MNEFLFFGTAVFCLFAALFAFRFWGKNGIFAWFAIATIIANVEVVKCVDLFGLSVTLGNVMYGSLFLCTDIFGELYGGKEARKLVGVGFFTLAVFTIVTQIGLLFVPNAQDWASDPMQQIFGIMPRICIASAVAYISSNTLDTYLYDWIGKKTNKKWLKNNGSTLLSQFVDTMLFVLIGFYGVFDFSAVLEIALTMYAVKVIFAVMDTPFLYLACKINDKYLKQ